LDGEEEFFDFPGQSTFRTQKGVFYQLLSDRWTTSSFSNTKVLCQKTFEYTSHIEAIVFEKLIVFNGDSGVDNVFRDLV